MMMKQNDGEKALLSAIRRIHIRLNNEEETDCGQNNSQNGFQGQSDSIYRRMNTTNNGQPISKPKTQENACLSSPERSFNANMVKAFSWKELVPPVCEIQSIATEDGPSKKRMGKQLNYDNS